MPDRSAARKLSRREELGVESRRKIVDAAAALMAERGFAGTSIAAVSKRSGLPSGSIYWHFESKEALLGAVVEEGARRWFDALPGSDSLPSDPAERATALLEAVGDVARAASRIPAPPPPHRARAPRGRCNVARGHPPRTRARRSSGSGRSCRYLLDCASIAKLADRLAGEFAPFVLCVADGAFVAQHIDPADTDLRRGLRPAAARAHGAGARAPRERRRTRADR